MDKLSSVFITFMILLSGIFGIMIYKNNNLEILDSTDYWNIYDESIKRIENNIDYISKSNIDIEDKEYLETLNNLAKDVQICYLGYTDDDKSYTTNPIRKYRNKNKITKKDLRNLNSTLKKEATDNFKEFEKYSSLKVSDDERLQTKIRDLTSNIVKLNNNLYATDAYFFNELLLKKIYEVHLVEDVSSFLVNEYDRLSMV